MTQVEITMSLEEAVRKIVSHYGLRSEYGSNYHSLEMTTSGDQVVIKVELTTGKD